MPINLSARASTRSVWRSGILVDENLWFYTNDDTSATEECPGKHGENAFPRYIKILSKDTQAHFDQAFQGDVFVSISQIERLAKSSESGMTVEVSNDDGLQEEAGSRPPAWVQKEADFVGEMCQNWDIRRTDDFRTQVRVGANGIAGSSATIFVRRHDKWRATVRAALKLGSGRSFKPTRQSNVPLTNPLVITPIMDHRQLVQDRLKQTMAGFLTVAVIEANKLSSGWKLEYHDQDQGKPNYVELSRDPFNFYKTWIHKNDWDSYMKGLAPEDGISIRPFISYSHTESYNALDDLLTAVGQRDIIIQANLTDDERRDLSLDVGQSAADLTEAAMIRRRKVNVGIKKKRLLGIQALQNGHNFDNGTTTIEIGLDVPKMDEAKGKRAAELSQKAVMGDRSATDIAHTIEGWETHRLGSGFFPSEWLHLGAFSWGGYMPPRSRSGFSTSQNFENLVFGTSETNSLMTRYEMAWQNFIRCEQELYKVAQSLQTTNKFSIIKFAQARLHITCNDFDKPIRHDVFKDNTYSFIETKLDQECVQNLRQLADDNMNSPNPVLTCKLVETLPNNDQPLFPETNIPVPHMLAIAYDFPFVVYSIDYTVEPRFRSILLNTQVGSKFSFSFFPFHRSLYHEAESVLDSVIWDTLKNAAHLAYETMRKINIENSQKNRQLQNALDAGHRMFKDPNRHA